MTATEITRCEKTTLRSKPVFVQDIMQETLRELTAPCDALVNGLALRLPAGCVVAVLGGGSGGVEGKLMTDLEFVGRDGKTYRATKGMDLRIPA
jgi:hypothetical protein